MYASFLIISNKNSKGFYVDLFDEQFLEQYLHTTPLLDFDSSEIKSLIQQHKWLELDSISERIGAIYEYVRDDIQYGYHTKFNIGASEVLSVGMGNSLIKTTLLIALLRAVGIPARVKAGTINKVIFRGLLGRLSFPLCLNQFPFAAAEIYFNGQWIVLGGHIIDRPYLRNLQMKFVNYMGSFYGYGIAVLHFRNPSINWEGHHTGIQYEAISNLDEVFDDPDSFFAAHPEIEKAAKQFRYRKIVLPTLNKNILKIRKFS